MAACSPRPLSPKQQLNFLYHSTCRCYSIPMWLTSVLTPQLLCNCPQNQNKLGPPFLSPYTSILMIVIWNFQWKFMYLRNVGCTMEFFSPVGAEVIVSRIQNLNSRSFIGHKGNMIMFWFTGAVYFEFSFCFANYSPQVLCGSCFSFLRSLNLRCLKAQTSNVILFLQ